MADITVFKSASISVQVIDGVPPIDQGAEVAILTAQVATLTTSLATMTADRDAQAAKVALAIADAQARKSADAAKVEGQDLLDALA